MANGTHDDDVDHGEVQVYPLSHDDLDKVTAGRDANGVWWAAGPCPACRGDAWGPDLLDAFDTTTRSADSYVVRERSARPETVSGEVLVRCRCGRDHGREGAGGCGRFYTVIVELER